MMVKDLVAGRGSSNPSTMRMAGNRLFFTAVSEEDGVELWAMGMFSASFSGITAAPAQGNANLIIRGQVNPFPSATVTIEYGTTPALGSTYVVGEFVGSTTVPFSATLYPGGIAPVTSYYYRVSATGEFGAIDTGVLSQVSFSVNADLSGISLSSGTLTPPFAGATTNYMSTVPFSTSSISVTPTKADQNATIEVSVNGESFVTLVSGSPVVWSLSVGANQLEIRTTAEAGNARTYAITVTRLDLPMIASPTVTATGGNGATLGGNVLANGGAVIIERGVIYSDAAVNSNPVINGPGVTKEIASGSLGIFTLPVSGLTQGAGYSMKAFATNSEGTSYSNALVFYTETTVIWNVGMAFFSRDLVRGVRQRYRFTLDELRIVSLVSEGGGHLRVDLRDVSGSVLDSFTGDADRDLKKMLPAGDYILEVYRLAGPVQPESYTLTIDSNVVPLTRPDLTVGNTATAPIGAQSYLPAIQLVSLTSLRARPVTGYATVSNHGNFPDIQSVQASSGNAFFAVTYFDPEGNVTAALIRGNYRTPELENNEAAVPIRILITPNKKKLIKKKRRKTRILKKTLFVNLTVTSKFDAAIRDAVSLRVQTQ
jgi:hypothetical protein